MPKKQTGGWRERDLFNFPMLEIKTPPALLATERLIVRDHFASKSLQFPDFQPQRRDVRSAYCGFQHRLLDCPRHPYTLRCSDYSWAILLAQRQPFDESEREIQAHGAAVRLVVPQ